MPHPSTAACLILRFSAAVVAWPRATVLAVLVVLASGVMHLQFDADTRTFVGTTGKHAQALQQFENDFGRSNLVIFIVTARSGDIFSAPGARGVEALEALQTLTWAG